LQCARLVFPHSGLLSVVFLDLIQSWNMFPSLNMIWHMLSVDLFGVKFASQIATFHTFAQCEFL
jgi:hypothetical protein